MTKKLLLLGIVLILSSYIVSAVCTQSGVTESSPYSDGETVTATVNCGASDKGDDGYFLWLNGSNVLIENDTFTIPSSSPFIVFPQLTINSSLSPQENFTGSLYVNGAFISNSSFNTTSTGGANILDIVDVETTGDIFCGKTVGIKGVIKNQGKLVGYADVCLDILDEDNEPLHHIDCKKSEVDGQFFFSERCDCDSWCNAGNSYLIDLDASCPKNSTSYVSCVNEDDENVVSSNGGTSKSFTVVDLEDKFIIKKWIDAGESVQPGIFVFNEFNSKVQMKKNPSDDGGYLTQQDIDWSVFNNTNTSFTMEQNGQAYITAGNTFTIGFIINNTFPDEMEFDVFECTVDDDNQSQEIFPLDPITKKRFGSEAIAHLSAKPSSEEGLVQKFTPPLLLAYDFVGGNDFDVQCKIKVHNFEQIFTVESDEFHIYGEVPGTDFVPIIDIKNITTTAFNTSQDACTQINVTMNYDYFGAIEEEFIVEYNFEQTDIDVIVKTIRKLIKPDNGKNNNITDTFFIPFVEVSGEAEVFIEIFNKDDIIVGFGDIEPHNTFSITADLSDGCRYSENLEQKLGLRTTVATEDIANKTGTFRFSVTCPSGGTVGNPMVCTILAYIEDPQVVQKEVDFTCYIKTPDGVRYSSDNFNQMVNRTPQNFSRSFNVPQQFSIGNDYQLFCEAGYYNFGSRTDTFYTTFRATKVGSTAGAGTVGDGTFLERAVDKLAELIKEKPLEISFVAAIIAIFLLILFRREGEDKRKGEEKVSKPLRGRESAHMPPQKLNKRPLR